MSKLGGLNGGAVGSMGSWGISVGFKRSERDVKEFQRFKEF